MFTAVTSPLLAARTVGSHDAFVILCWSVLTVVTLWAVARTLRAYMLGLAFHSFKTDGKPKQVEMFGVNMAVDEEYTDQRPCCEYWCGRMEEAGMEVHPSDSGALLIANNGLYGFENYNPICWTIQQQVFGVQHGISQCDKELERWKLQRAKNEGALYAHQQWLRKAQRGEM